MSIFTLKRRHAIVTGGSRGIGLAIATQLAAAGASITLFARDSERLKLAQTQLFNAGYACEVIAVDVTNEAAVNAAFTQARARFGAVDILVNNAGAAESLPFTKASVAHLEQMMTANLRSVWLCTQAFAVDVMAEGARDKRVINVASTAGLIGYAYTAAYTAAKHAVVGLTRALAVEWAKKPVTVNAVCPGFTDTDIVADAVRNIIAKTGRSENEARATLAARNPQGKLISPEQVANTVLWLASPGSEAINGQAISISGGEVV